jgi:hypothetical protein
LKLAPLASLVLAIPLLTPPAYGKAIFSAPLSPGVGQSADCVVQNVGTKARAVTVRLLDNLGAQISIVNEIEIPPGAVQGILAAGAGSIGVYCSFEGLSSTLRGVIQISAPGTLVSVQAGK